MRTYHLFIEEPNKALSVNRTLHYVIRDNSIKCDHRNDGIADSSHKSMLNSTAVTPTCPSISPHCCPFILCCLINK